MYRILFCSYLKNFSRSITIENIFKDPIFFLSLDQSLDLSTFLFSLQIFLTREIILFSLSRTLNSARIHAPTCPLYYWNRISVTSQHVAIRERICKPTRAKRGQVCNSPRNGACVISQSRRLFFEKPFRDKESGAKKLDAEMHPPHLSNL